MASSVPYHEPSIESISILSGFLLTLNIVNYGLDKLAYCGLLGQVVLGIAWGTPGGKLLSIEIERVVVQLGYLGLILLVFEGGLSTSFRSMKANLWLSTGVAVTGIAVPIGLSLILRPMMGASVLQAFTAGAALCSTSLGTTFTILGTSGLSSTRLGVVLTSAAMLDDVVGLIMVQVVSNLGAGEFDPVTVVRPVLVSLAFAVVVPVVCRLLVLPVTMKLNGARESSPNSTLSSLLKLRSTAFVMHTSILFVLVVAGTFAGTSSLLAAYIAGAAVSWWDSEVAHVQRPPSSPEAQHDRSGSEAAQPSDPTEAPASVPRSQSVPSPEPVGLGAEVFEQYYKPVLEHILKPFFFASIGFSIPITRMFSGQIVWRGVIYTTLMTTSKMACGLWLMPFPNPFRIAADIARRTPIFKKSQVHPMTCSPPRNTTITLAPEADTRDTDGITTDNHPPSVSPSIRNSSLNPKKPKSLYPASIIGLGMVARGEIGYLVASLAESKGIFGSQSDGLFLVVVWAISLCTIIGPIGIGLLVNRVKALKAASERPQSEGASSLDVLGAWGVN